MITVTATADWHNTHPGAFIGLLELSGVENPSICPPLNQRKREVEAQLRRQYPDFSRKDLLAHPVMAAYTRYYKRFSKTYHVLLQVESILSGTRTLPDVSPLVDANFAAEVTTFLLSAGHDAEKLAGPVVMDVARQGDQMTMMNGTSKPACVDDMVMRDSQSLCCSILYGQDNRSPITRATRNVLYVTYAPPGVSSEDVENHLHLIEEHVRLVCPHAILEQSRLLEA